jgi:isoleucyl-tRNA synthetase
VQFVRERIAEGDEKVKHVLQVAYVNLLRLAAPIVPFLTEKVWQELRAKKIVQEESVHLSGWPKYDGKKIDEKLEREFENAVKIIELGLAERDKAKIGLRWPLASAEITWYIRLNRLESMIKSQLNVKKIIWKEGHIVEHKVILDMKTTPELEAEGFSRELARRVQAERKNTGLVKSDIIELKISCDKSLQEKFSTNIVFLKERINAKKIEFVEGKLSDKQISFEIRKRKISFVFCNFCFEKI